VKDARDYVEMLEYFPVVVKADGLAAGKGVIICETKEEALAALDETMVEARFGDAGNRVVIEDFLRGQEASIHAVTDGDTLILFPTAQDHKRVGDGDKGPNTGGMGAYSPAPVVEGAMLDKIVKTILVPTLHALKREGIAYRGALFTGLMMTKGGPRVLEYNCRFGDPETQVILPRIKSDLGLVFAAVADGKLDTMDALDIDDRAAVGVVVASEGYPAHYQVGKTICGLDAAEALDGVEIYHAGTRDRGGQIVTSGGRVLCVTALGDGFRTARDQAYAAVGKIRFEGAYTRDDIASRVL
jgi:phosphoribosylamine--glycine ligase